MNRIIDLAYDGIVPAISRSLLELFIATLKLFVATMPSRSALSFAATVSGMDAAAEPTRTYLRRVVANDRAERRFAGTTLFFTTAILMLLNANFVFAANTLAPRAMVDRTVVSEGDSLTLTIRIDDTGSYDEPDYSPLQKDFEVYGTSESSQHVINNGRIESWTEWQTSLTPKHSGQLQIPPLAVAGARTQPITIQVNAASNANAVDSSEPVIVEVQTDRKDVYVQQQILLTARVYIAVQLENLQLTKPEFDNASVKQVGETTFNRTVNGTQYEVHELTYAIFPQQPGDLTIPELVFNAVEATGRRSLFDFPGRGRAIRKMSRQLSIHVKPIPKNFSGQVWLPARNLTLTETWNGDPHHVAAGDSITRSIAIRADGLLAAQLPKLDQPQLDAAKLYADQPALDDQQDTSGVHGKRIENTALIPTRAGQLQLPETRVVWWDVDSDSEKVATLSGETMNIAAGANTASAPPPPPLPQTTQQPATPVANPTPVSVPAINQIDKDVLLWWQLATALLLFAWLATLFAYGNLRKKSKQAISAPTANSAITDDADAWRNLSAACHANSPIAARQALLQWAQIFYRNENIHSIEQLQHIANDRQLTRELQLLDNRLFGVLPDSVEWNGEALLQVVKDFKNKSFANDKTQTSTLPPLYPVA